MKNYSTEIAQAIKEHLEEREMKLVAFDENDGSFGFVMHLPGQISFVHYIIKVHENDFTVVAICPVCPATSDSAVLTAMAEFVCRANYGLKNGNFEMDFRDGELRYKCFVDCDEQIPSQNVVRDSIGVPAAMMKRYASGIINVLYKGMDAESAVAKCEQGKGLLHEFEEAKRALEGLLRKRHSADDSESDQDNATVADGESEGFPSFEEFLRIMASSEDTSQSEDDTEGVSETDANNSASDSVA